MVNGGTPCDDVSIVRRIAAAAVMALALGACSDDAGREFARYYDPQRQFVTNLPAANEVVVTQPQSTDGAPTILTGVISTPPAPSPSPQAGFGGGFAATASEPPDQTIYQIIVVTTDAFEDLDEMGLFFLSGDPVVDVQVDESVRIDGHEGRLLVADVTPEGVTTASIAAAFTLGHDGEGYVVAAVFPPGEWEAERGDFFRVLESFRVGVPPGLETFPVSGGAA
jgi:hypothetical protein